MAKLIEVKLAWNRENRSIWVNPDIIAGIDNIGGSYTLYTSQPIGNDSYSQKHPITREEWYRLKAVLFDAKESEEETATPIPEHANCRCWIGEAVKPSPADVPLYCVIVKKDETTLEGWTCLLNHPPWGLLVQPSIKHDPDAWSIQVHHQEVASIFPAFPPETDL